jgi:hypothetical protein
MKPSQREPQGAIDFYAALEGYAVTWRPGSAARRRTDARLRNPPLPPIAPQDVIGLSTSSDKKRIDQ